MRFISTATASTLVLTFVSVTVVGSAAQAPAVPAGMPPGPGKDTLTRVCSDCHGLDVIEGQRRTRAQWSDVVQDMVARGANATDEDTKAIINYLATALGRVNVNKAEAMDIQTVVELSADESAAIVKYRMASGEFKNLDDLKKVPGLDPAKVEAKKDRITFAGQ